MLPSVVWRPLWVSCIAVAPWTGVSITTLQLCLAVTGNLAGSFRREAKYCNELIQRNIISSPVPCLIRFMKPHVSCFQCYDLCREAPVVRSLVSLFLVQTLVFPPRKKHSRKDFISGYPWAYPLGSHSCKILGRAS